MAGLVKLILSHDMESCLDGSLGGLNLDVKLLARVLQVLDCL